MEAIADTVDEIDPELEGAWILTLGTSLLHVDGLGLKSEHISLVLGDQTGDFTGSEHRVDGLEETFTLNFRVGHDEGNLLAKGTSFSVKVLDVVLEVGFTIGLSQSNLEEDLLTDEGREFGKGLLTGTTNSDQEAVTSG